MKKKSITVIVFVGAVVLLALGTLVLVSSGCNNDDVSLESFVPTFPGSYGISLKWKAPSGVVKVRVGIYSFRSDGSFRADYWQWESNENGAESLVWADMIGEGVPYGYDDADKRIVTQRKFLYLELTTEFGEWSSHSDGTRVRIDWENGAQEWWKLTWQDETINKLEAYYLSTAANWRDFYLENPNNPGTTYSPYYFQRNNYAENSGFALGCRESFSDNAQPTLAFQGKFSGVYFKTNYYKDATDIGLNYWTINLGRRYRLTNYNVWRYVIKGTEQGHWVFHYLDVPTSGNTGLKSRRVHMQVDHDSNNDRHISDESGHVCLGFQIIDANDDVRGFMFVEAAYDPEQGRYMMLSSMYLLDDLSEEAKTGILVDPYLD